MIQGWKSQNYLRWETLLRTTARCLDLLLPLFSYADLLSMHIGWFHYVRWLMCSSGNMQWYHSVEMPVSSPSLLNSRMNDRRRGTTADCYPSSPKAYSKVKLKGHPQEIASHQWEALWFYLHDFELAAHDKQVARPVTVQVAFHGQIVSKHFSFLSPTEYVKWIQGISKISPQQYHVT